MFGKQEDSSDVGLIKFKGLHALKQCLVFCNFQSHFKAEFVI